MKTLSRMVIQLDLARLERHLSSLEEELREVRTLYALTQARQMEPDTMPECIAQQMQYLEDQQQWIQNRQQILKLTLQKFTRICQENRQCLAEAKRLMQRTDSHELSEWGEHQ